MGNDECNPMMNSKKVILFYLNFYKNKKQVVV